MTTRGGLHATNSNHILGYTDAAVAPIDYPVSPKAASDKLLAKLGLNHDDVDLWEVNEALAVVVLANTNKDKLDMAKVNVHGGAISLGHPFGASGARITGRFAFSLSKGQKGLASICNGGGGSSAILVEKC